MKDTEKATKFQRHSIGKVKAIAMYGSDWWKSCTPAEIFRFQFFTEEAVGHPVFTHQFVTCYDLLAKEFLKGQSQPTSQEINAFADKIWHQKGDA